jgi:hypothetical protein
LKYLKKEVLRRSKIPNLERPDELVIRKEDPKKLLLVEQLLLKMDWDSLTYQSLWELFDGGFVYVFETRDHCIITVGLSGQTDDMPREETLGLGIRPTIDLRQSLQLRQSVLKAVNRFIEEADVEWRKDELKQLKQEILRRSTVK